MNSIECRKKILRQKILQDRMSLDPLYLQRINADICHRVADFLYHKKNIAFYFPIKNEVDLSSLWPFLWKKKIITLLPKLLGSKDMAFFPFESIEELVEGKYGIYEPISREKVDNIDIIFIPGLAFDIKGNRLGYGEGYYDRFLSNSFNANKIGICSEAYLLSEIPVVNYDISMDYIITNNSFIHI